MSHQWAVLVALVVIVSCAGPTPRPGGGPASPPGVTPFLRQTLPTDLLVTTDTLDNGLRYYIRRNSQPPKRLELRLVVRAGSVLEEASQQGLARLVGRLACRATEHSRAAELADCVRATGQEFDPALIAHTGFDQTVYELSVPTESTAPGYGRRSATSTDTSRSTDCASAPAASVDASDCTCAALQVLATWAGSVRFDAHAVERERAAVLKEGLQAAGAEARLRARTLPILLAGSRYADRLPWGRRAVLDTFQREDLRRFYRTWYQPGEMAVVAVGDCDPRVLERNIRACFGTLSGSGAPRTRPRYLVPDHDTTRVVIATDARSMGTRVTVYTKDDIPDESTVGAYRQHLVELLYHRLLNRRLEQMARGLDAPFVRAGSGQVRLVATKRARVLQCGVEAGGALEGLAALLTEARRASVRGFSETELEREKAELLSFMEQAHADREQTKSSVYAAEYIRNFMRAEPIPGIAYEYGLYTTFVPRIRLAEVNALARRANAERNRVVSVSLSARADTPAPTSAAVREVLARVRTASVGAYDSQEEQTRLLAADPPPGVLTSTEEITALGVVRWTLGNGIQVFAKSTDFADDEVLFSASGPGGTAAVADSEYVAALTADALARDSGVGRFDRHALGRILSGRRVQVVPWIGELRQGLRGGAAPADLETLFQLIRLFLTAPRADSTAFVSYQTWLRDSLGRRRTDPEAAFRDTLAALLAQHHPRAGVWSEDMVAQMDLEDSRRIYRRLFADPSQFSFYFVGAFATDTLRDLAVRYLGGLPASGGGQSPRDVQAEPPRGVVERRLYMGTGQESRTAVIFAGEAPWSHAQAMTLEALALLLRIRLHEALAGEEDAGTLPDASVRATFSHFPEGRYRVAVEFSGPPGRADELSRLLFTQISALRTSGPDSAAVSQVRRLLQQQHAADLKENAYWLELLESCRFHGLDPRRVLRREGQLDDLTPASLCQAAVRYLPLDRYIRVVLLPERYRGTVEDAARRPPGSGTD